MKIKAILFDMDGVLVDSVDAWFKLFNITLKYFGKKEMTKKEFLSKVWGGPIERDARVYFGKTVDEVKKFYFDNFDEFKKNLKLFLDTKETLSELRKKGLKLGLVTNTPKGQAYALIDYVGLRKYFDKIVCGDEVEHGKPEPDLLIECCKRLKTGIKDIIFVGDAKVDKEAARKAGSYFVGFKIDGDKRISGLKELLEMV